MSAVDPSRVAALASAADLGEVIDISPMTGGANNRVFRVETAAGPVLLKSYFRHPDDPRDRLGTEFSFAHFAWDSGVRGLPRPLASDPEFGLGLFEYVAGRPLRIEEVDDDAVVQAIDFFRSLNRGRTRPEAQLLPRASESCLSLDDHFNLVRRRVERLNSFAVASDVDAAAEAFARDELAAAWPDLLARAETEGKGLGLPRQKPLDPAELCLSPSDFGYHNAILADSGRLCFIDFEYAGWDDPSKLICDFFCQPALPAPAGAYRQFARSVAAELPSPRLHEARADLLLPIYRMKWCCIMLNEFLAVGGRRRVFSGSESEQEQRKGRQLEKARRAFAVLGQSLSFNRRVA